MNCKKEKSSEKKTFSDRCVLDKAFFFYNKKNYKEAENFFALALEEEENAEAYFFRGKSFLKLGKPLAAMGCFENAKDLAPDNPDIYIEGTIALLQLNFPEKALAWLESHPCNKTKTGKFFALKGSALLQKKDYRQAAGYFLYSIKKGEKSSYIFSELAMTYFFLNEYKNATKYFKLSYQKSGIHNVFGISQLYYEALSFKELGKYKKALMLLNKIPKIIDDELFAKILSLQSICYFNLGKSDKALFHINASIGINPANSNYYKIKSTILNHLNLIEQSILCEKKAIEVDDENKRKELQMKQIIEEQANELKNKIEYYEQRTSIYNEKLKENPTSATLYSQKAAVLMELQQYHETISCCNNALKFNPKEKNALKDKSRALFALGRYKEALNCIIKIED